MNLDNLFIVGKRVVIRPVDELVSDTIVIPQRKSRWNDDPVVICGEVVATGRKGIGVETGDIVYFSDSCSKPVDNGYHRVINEDDIMFITDIPIPVEWIGAKETYDE